MRSLPLLLAAALAATAGAQTTWTVPTNVPTLQAAIDAAQPGDTITMVSMFTDSAGSVVLSKALALVDCRLAYPDNSFGLRVTGITGGARLELRNVTIANSGDGFANTSLSSEALRIDLPASATGDLVFDQVQVRGSIGSGLPDSRAALLVLSLGGATLTARGCTFRGRDSTPLSYQNCGEVGPAGGTGAVLAAPGRYLFEDCAFTGGRGGTGFANAMTMVAGAHGGAGLRTAGNAVLVHCTVTDGDGGDALFCNPPPFFRPPNPCAMAAAPGASILPADLFGVTWVQGGVGTVTGCANPPPPPPVLPLGRAVDVLPAAATFTTGQPIVLQVAWQPGDLAVALGAGGPFLRVDLPGVIGPLWMQQVVFNQTVGPPGPSGLVTPPLPNVPAGLGVPVDFVVQVAHVRATYLELGAPRVITLRQ